MISQCDIKYYHYYDLYGDKKILFDFIDNDLYKKNIEKLCRLNDWIYNDFMFIDDNYQPYYFLKQNDSNVIDGIVILYWREASFTESTQQLYNSLYIAMEYNIEKFYIVDAHPFYDLDDFFGITIEKISLNNLPTRGNFLLGEFHNMSCFNIKNSDNFNSYVKLFYDELYRKYYEHSVTDVYGDNDVLVTIRTYDFYKQMCHSKYKNTEKFLESFMKNPKKVYTESNEAERRFLTLPDIDYYTFLLEKYNFENVFLLYQDTKTFRNPVIDELINYMRDNNIKFHIISQNDMKKDFINLLSSINIICACSQSPWKAFNMSKKMKNIYYYHNEFDETFHNGIPRTDIKKHKVIKNNSKYEIIHE